MKMNSCFPCLLGAALLLSACVPADQTIAVLNQQNSEAATQLSSERRKTGELLQTRSKLEAELAAKRSRISTLQADPVSNQAEIARLNREVAAIERHLSRAL